MSTDSLRLGYLTTILNAAEHVAERGRVIQRSPEWATEHRIIFVENMLISRFTYALGDRRLTISMPGDKSPLLSMDNIESLQAYVNANHDVLFQTHEHCVGSSNYKEPEKTFGLITAADARAFHVVAYVPGNWEQRIIAEAGPLGPVSHSRR